MNASILIVTRNRAADLSRTLCAMRNVIIPSELETELLVIDNGSTDDTRQVVASAKITRLPLRYIHEPRIGQTIGRNRGLHESTGDVILFTDDDVRAPAGWLVDMCEPILSGKADAVCGGVGLAPHLLRPWMSRLHRSWLASTEWLTRQSPQSMVGANMAFSRRVLSKVPGFDPELGPGASGFCDDTLFSAQLLTAGHKIHDGLDVRIVHHYDPDRMNRESWLNAAWRRGESHAYIGHHWQHWGLRLGGLRVWQAARRLEAWRARNPELMINEGCYEEELKLVLFYSLMKWRLHEMGQPRKYAINGLVKLRSGSRESQSRK